MSNRDLTAGVLAELTAPDVRIAFFVEIEYDSGGSPAFLRLWTGFNEIVWDSKTWTGAGDILRLNPLDETIDVRAVRYQIILSGVKSSLIAIALSGRRQNRPVRVYLGFFETDDSLIVDPYLFFQGRLDSMSIDEAGDTATITVDAESHLIDLQRLRLRRFTHEDQQIDFPGDLGFFRVNTLGDWNGQWGTAWPRDSTR